MLSISVVAIALMAVFASGRVEAQSGSIPESNLMHRVVLDSQGDYVMLWTPRENDVIFEVHVATTGYVGLGFSTNGGMRNSDIILGWVKDDNGQVYLHDRFATEYAVPNIDKSQDVKLLGGGQNGTHTVLKFSRPWQTCDEEEDMELSSDTVHIIWSYGSEDPVDEMNMQRHVQRGSKSLYLQAPQFVLPKLGKDVESWDILASNVSLPDDLKTLYWCKLFKIPSLPRKTHMIGSMPVIEEGNSQHVHHILVYECHLPDSARHYEKWLGVDGAQCFGPNMPLSWKSCSTPILGWAVGGEGMIMPEHVGIPLGEEHGGATYLMIEIHYDNPDLRKGVVDNSGIRIFHTEKLRQYEAGVMSMGHSVEPNMMIPPGENWLTIGHCSGICTRNMYPQNGVKVFSSFLHTHLLGNSVTVRHIRNDKELPVLSKDLNYDFNFQQFRRLKEEVTILPGDSLITECRYDSTKRRVPTFGGFGTQEEMCLAFLSYYPRTDLATCGSSPTQKNILDSLGITNIYKNKKGKSDESINRIDEEAEIQKVSALKNGKADKLVNIDLVQLLRRVIIKSPVKYLNQSLYDVVVSEETWKDKEVVAKLQDTVVNGKHKAGCWRKEALREADAELSGTISYPQFTPLPPPVKTCTIKKQVPWKPLLCLPQLPSCNQNGQSYNSYGNRPYVTRNNPYASGNRPHASGNSPYFTRNHPHASGNRPHTSGNSPYFTRNRPHASGNRPHVSGNSPYFTRNRPYASGNRPYVSRNRPYHF